MKLIVSRYQGGWDSGRPGSQVDGRRYATTFYQPPSGPENASLEDSCLARRCDAECSECQDSRLASFLEDPESLLGWWRKDPGMECFVENTKPLRGWREDASVERFFQDAESILRWRWGWRKLE